MLKFSKTDLGILLYLRWSPLQQLVMVGPTTNGKYWHVAVVTPPCLPAKLKSDEDGHALNVASDTLSCFIGMFLHFFENTNYFLFH